MKKEIIEARFNNVMNNGKQVLVCTVKNLNRMGMEKILKEFSKNPSFVVCDERFHFYNIQNDGIIRIEKEKKKPGDWTMTLGTKTKKKHWWSRR